MSEGDIREEKFYEIRVPQRIFHTTVVDHESLNVHLRQAIKEYKKTYDPHEVVGLYQNVKAWHTDYYTHQETDGFKPLIDLVEKYAHYASKEYCKAEINPPYYYHVNNLWAVEYGQDDYSKMHTHFPAVWSACYYVDVEEHAAPIIFGDQEKIVVQPENGTLLLWFGTVPHRVEPTFSKRTCICMNLHVQWGNYE